MNNTSTPIVDKWNGETVLCIPRKHLNLPPEPDVALLTLTKKSTKGLHNLEQFLFDSHQQGRFVPRVECEHDPSLKQLIPYIVVINSSNEVLLYDRAASGGEARLHGQTSLGIGGHINPTDMEDINRLGPMNAPGHLCTILNAAEREVKEELGLDILEQQDAYIYKLLALVNNDGDDVGKVHLGVVFFLFLAQGKECKFEEHLHNPRWTHHQVLAGMPDDSLEVWSQLLKPLVLDYLTDEQTAREIARQMELDRQRDDGPDYSKGAEPCNEVHHHTGGEAPNHPGIVGEGLNATIGSGNTAAAPLTLEPCQGPGGVAGRTVHEMDNGSGTCAGSTCGCD